MNMKIIGTLFAVILTMSIQAQSKLPGNPELVSTDEELQALVAHDEGDYKYSVADYFARPNASSFQLSPNGKYLSYMEKEGLKNHVYIKELATGEVVRAIEEKEEPIKGGTHQRVWLGQRRAPVLRDGSRGQRELPYLRGRYRWKQSPRPHPV
jgi:hypothetical protein